MRCIGMVLKTAKVLVNRVKVSVNVNSVLFLIFIVAGSPLVQKQLFHDHSFADHVHGDSKTLLGDENHPASHPDGYRVHNIEPTGNTDLGSKIHSSLDILFIFFFFLQLTPSACMNHPPQCILLVK